MIDADNFLFFYIVLHHSAYDSIAVIVVEETRCVTASTSHSGAAMNLED